MILGLMIELPWLRYCGGIWGGVGGRGVDVVLRASGDVDEEDVKSVVVRLNCV
jgi:hypothetical protein